MAYGCQPGPLACHQQLSQKKPEEPEELFLRPLPFDQGTLESIFGTTPTQSPWVDHLGPETGEPQDDRAHREWAPEGNGQSLAPSALQPDLPSNCVSYLTRGGGGMTLVTHMCPDGTDGRVVKTRATKMLTESSPYGTRQVLPL